MKEYLDRLIGLDEEIIKTPPIPDELWGEDLTKALILFYAMRQGKDFNIETSMCMIWFELGRRYERRWPQEQTIDLPQDITVNQPRGPQKTREEVIAILEAREEFAIKYGKAKGWADNTDNWDIKQRLEVREQPGWKEPEL